MCHFTKKFTLVISLLYVYKFIFREHFFLKEYHWITTPKCLNTGHYPFQLLAGFFHEILGPNDTYLNAWINSIICLGNTTSEKFMVNVQNLQER